MIDTHCHMLPGVDDGSADLATSLAMAEAAYNSGVSCVIVTPHCNVPGEANRNYLSPALRSAFYALRDAIREAGIPLQIMPGMEIMCTEETTELIRAGKMLSLAGSRYMLLEFFFDAPAHFMTGQLRAVAALGLTPVVAHPERYAAVQDDPLLAERWFNAGYVLQVNGGSLLGQLGGRAELAADVLVTRGLCHLVASDAHDTRFRPAALDNVYAYIRDIYSAKTAELLLNTNPQRILTNQPVLPASDR